MTSFKKILTGVCIAMLCACILYGIFILPYTSSTADIITSIIMGVALLILHVIGIEKEK